MAIGARRARPVRLSVSTGIGRLFTVLNTLAGSSLPSVRVKGEPVIYAALYPRLSAVKARAEAVRNRRLVLIPRITVLEGGTAGAVTIPPATTDPAYGAGDQVVANATRFDGFLGDVFELRTTEAAGLAATRSRINALKNPPAQRAFFSDPFFVDPFFTRA